MLIKVCDNDLECHHKRRLNKKIDFLSFFPFILYIVL